MSSKPWQFQPGQLPNPGGKVAGVFSDEALKLIASDYLSNFDRGQIEELYNDKKRFNKLSTAHAMVVTRIVASLALDGRLDFDCVMDRLIGKAVQKSSLNVQVDRRDLITSIITTANALLIGEDDGRTIIDVSPESKTASPDKA